MSKQSYEMFDAMIKIAGREVMRREAESLPSEDEIDYTFSPEFELKMNKLIRQHNHTAPKTIKQALRLIAACIAVLALTFVSAFALVPQFRESVMTALIEWTGISAGFTFGDSDTDVIESKKPSYIPDGFAETDVREKENALYVTYADDLGIEIYFSRIEYDGLKMSIDSEHSDYSTTTINGLEAHVFTSNTIGYPSLIVFNDDIYAYRIAGEIPVDELIRIARSIPMDG